MGTQNGQNQGPFCMWQGLDLSNWIRLLRRAPALGWSHWGRIAGITATACSNSALSCLERLAYRQRVEQTHVPAPLFVIGHWRSGTTLLHNLLAHDTQFVTPNLYQVVFPGHFLISERIIGPMTARFLPSKRSMDNIPITGWDIPQEDEIAICLLSLLSPYLMLAFPEDREVYAPYLDLEKLPGAVRDRWKAVFVHFLKKLMVGRAGQRPLLKSPSHTYRIPLLLELFPDAKFVHIVRDPYRVIPSTLHLRRITFADNALHDPDFSRIEEDSLALYEHCFEQLERDLPRLGAGQVHELRLEDLEADIPGELAKIYDALALPGFSELEKAVRLELPKLRNFRKNEFEPSARLEAQIERRCRRVFDRYGYARKSATRPDLAPVATSDRHVIRAASARSHSALA